MIHSLGNVYGKQSDPRFNLPRGMIMDDKRNFYVADTQNHPNNYFAQNFKNNEPNLRNHSCSCIINQLI
jgi:hypothetical protein